MDIDKPLCDDPDLVHQIPKDVEESKRDTWEGSLVESTYILVGGFSCLVGQPFFVENPHVGCKILSFLISLYLPVPPKIMIIMCGLGMLKCESPGLN